MKDRITQAVKSFDTLPDSALLTLNDACLICQRSRASFYRDAKNGSLNLLKVGCTTRIRAAELRRFIGEGL